MSSIVTESVSKRAEEAAPPSKSTYVQILKSTAMVGGSTAVNIGVGIVRTKAMAILLGPAGFGLMGLYGAILDLVQSVAGMGVNSSGVRQIAAAASSGDTARMGQTAAVLRRVSVILGLLGAATLILSSRQAAALTFGTDERAGAIALLSLAVLFRVVSGGQGALVQGMRRISDLVRINILGALVGTFITIPVIYFYRDRGVVPSLVAVAAVSLVASWWYSRKVWITPPAMTASETWREAKPLLALGFAFMASGLMSMGSAYVVRIIVLRSEGVEATGLYQAAWSIGGLYVGMILQAMGADFYPRLTAVANDNMACNRLANEQVRIGMLLAGPGIVATLTLAPLFLLLLYSPEFVVAVETLRWICLGIALRVMIWPVSYIIVAKGRQRLFIYTDLAWTAVNIGLTWPCVLFFGLTGAGIAFFASYVFYGALVYWVMRPLSDFRWSSDNLRSTAWFLALILGLFAALSFLSGKSAIGVGLFALVASSLYSVRVLVTLVPKERIPHRFRSILTRWMPRAPLSEGEQS